MTKYPNTSQRTVGQHAAGRTDRTSNWDRALLHTGVVTLAVVALGAAGLGITYLMPHGLETSAEVKTIAKVAAQQPGDTTGKFVLAQLQIAAAQPAAAAVSPPAMLVAAKPKPTEPDVVEEGLLPPLARADFAIAAQDVPIAAHAAPVMLPVMLPVEQAPAYAAVEAPTVKSGAQVLSPRSNSLEVRADDLSAVPVVAASSPSSIEVEPKAVEVSRPVQSKMAEQGKARTRITAPEPRHAMSAAKPVAKAAKLQRKHDDADESEERSAKRHADVERVQRKLRDEPMPSRYEPPVRHAGIGCGSGGFRPTRWIGRTIYWSGMGGRCM